MRTENASDPAHRRHDPAGPDLDEPGPDLPLGTTPRPLDWALAVLALIVALYPVLPLGSGGFDAFLDRQGSLDTVEVLMGAPLTVLVLEACRRTTGLVLPLVCLGFFLNAYYGGFLPVTACWRAALGTRPAEESGGQGTCGSRASDSCSAAWVSASPHTWSVTSPAR